MEQKQKTTWNEDRYLSILIQRNILMILTVFLSLSLLAGLVIIKDLNNKKIIEPYLIEYNETLNQFVAIDSETKKSYTAQEIIKESFITQYIQNREGIKSYLIEENVNKVRVFSAPVIYQDFLKNSKEDIMALSSSGKSSYYAINFTSLTYMSPNKIEVKFQKTLFVGETETWKKNFRVILVFDFYDLELAAEEARINPLGFQVTYYRLIEEKSLTGQ
jgi:type IV secretory pathway component VirB8